MLMMLLALLLLLLPLPCALCAAAADGRGDESFVQPTQPAPDANVHVDASMAVLIAVAAAIGSPIVARHHRQLGVASHCIGTIAAAVAASPVAWQWRC